MATLLTLAPSLPPMVCKYVCMYVRFVVWGMYVYAPWLTHHCLYFFSFLLSFYLYLFLCAGKSGLDYSIFGVYKIAPPLSVAARATVPAAGNKGLTVGKYTYILTECFWLLSDHVCMDGWIGGIYQCNPKTKIKAKASLGGQVSACVIQVGRYFYVCMYVCSYACLSIDWPITADPSDLNFFLCVHTYMHTCTGRYAKGATRGYGWRINQELTRL